MYVIGVDLGQKRDHTAIVMVEKPYRHPLASVVDPTLTVRMAQRLPLASGANSKYPGRERRTPTGGSEPPKVVALP